MAEKVSRGTVALEGVAREWSELVGEESPVKLLKLKDCWLLYGEPVGRGEVHAVIHDLGVDPTLAACELVAQWVRAGTLARAGWRIPLTTRVDLVERLLEKRGASDDHARVLAQLEVSRGLREGVSDALSGDLLEVLAGGSMAALDVLSVVALLRSVASEFKP